MYRVLLSSSDLGLTHVEECAVNRIQGRPTCEISELGIRLHTLNNVFFNPSHEKTRKGLPQRVQ